MPVDDQTTVGREAVAFYQRLLRYLRTAVEGMDGDLLAWRPAPDTTAISNIVLHIVGSTRDVLTVADLVGVRPRPARDQTLTGLQVLLNGYGHASGHLAQIELTRQLYENRSDRD